MLAGIGFGQTLNKADLPSSIKDSSFFESRQIPYMLNSLSKIDSLYGSRILLYSNMACIPPEITKSFIFIESKGDSMAVSPELCTGVLQILASSATDIIILAKREGCLHPEQIQELSRILGEVRTDKILSFKLLGNKAIKRKELYNVDLNLLLGTMYLSVLINRVKCTGKSIRWDKVAVGYNSGYFAYNSGRDLKGNVKSVVKSVNRESSNYVLKLLGKNGILRLILK